MSKPGRNDSCPCGSGKKFKKCCEKPPQRRGLQATVISSGETAGKFSSLFKNNIQVDVESKPMLMAEKISTTPSQL